jgi:selenocysteine lyase/cysteine desulfurase
VGPYEHHSNLLPWTESVAEVVEIGLTPKGQIDYDELERVASDPKYDSRPIKVGSFSIASNVRPKAKVVASF